MSEMSRFIQFNDETIDPNDYLTYERLARALTEEDVLIAERQLLEIQIAEKTIAMSVFWRHRSPSVTHSGRLTDIYLLSLGFWSHFNLKDWRTILMEYEGKYPELLQQLTLLFEEVRLSEMIQQERKGTRKHFKVRVEQYLLHHENRLKANIERGDWSDALINQLYLYIHEGSLYTTLLPKHFPIAQLEHFSLEVEQLKSTADSTWLALRFVLLMEQWLTHDVTTPYYAFNQFLTVEKIRPFSYHEGMKEAEWGKEDEKETIEEVYRTWHRESDDEEGVHLQYELSHGTKGKSLSEEAEQGRDAEEIDHIQQGASHASSDRRSDEQSVDEGKESSASGEAFDYGIANRHVDLQLEPMPTTLTNEQHSLIEEWRQADRKEVKRFVQEIERRMEKKKESPRKGMQYGRVQSSALLQLWTTTRPKIFYKKNQPAKPLDAVFGLLIDTSGSMWNKLDETKRAVLLFHDILTQLRVAHQLTTYSEDAIRATKEMQPNIFKMIHSFEALGQDAAHAIMNMEAEEDNRDGFAIRWMANQLKYRPEKHRFLFVFSDGEPSAFHYGENGIVDTREAVIEAERMGIQVLHLFLNDEEPTEQQLALFRKIYGTKSVATNHLQAFNDQTLRMLRKLMQHILK